METATTMIKDAGEEKGVCKREEGTIWFRNNEKKKNGNHLNWGKVISSLHVP